MAHPLPCMEHCDGGSCRERISSTGRIPPAHHCARGRISAAPAAKFHWEATNTYLPSTRYSAMAVGGAAAALQVTREQKA